MTEESDELETKELTASWSLTSGFDEAIDHSKKKTLLNNLSVKEKEIFEAGFNKSCEGFNGEIPPEDEDRLIELYVQYKCEDVLGHESDWRLLEDFSEQLDQNRYCSRKICKVCDKRLDQQYMRIENKTNHLDLDGCWSRISHILSHFYEEDMKEAFNFRDHPHTIVIV